MSPQTPRPNLTVFQRLQRNFLTGLVVVLPGLLTIYVLMAVVSFVDAQVEPLIPARYNPENLLGTNISGLGLLVFLVFTTLAGALTRGVIGRRIIGWGESLVERMPVVRSIYNAVKQILETVLSKSGTSFRQACLVEYPRKGIWSIAFISTEARGEVPTKTQQPEMVAVFLPTTPNPTSGYLLFVPKADVIPLDMSVEEAAKMIISAGLVTPPQGTDTQAPAMKPAH